MHKSNKNHQVQNVQKLKKELLFKFVILGDFGVGKTSIIKRYAEGTYSPIYKITIGADFAIRTLNFDDYTKIVLQLWDIAGHERFGCATSIYYRYAVAAAIVFDLTRPETFISVTKWISDLNDKVVLPSGQPLPIILLANKGDVNLANVPPHLPDFCKKNNILAWFITSARDNSNITEAMHFLTKAAIENYNSETYNSDGTIITLTTTKEKRKCFCCSTT